MARYIMIVVLGGMLTFGIANISQNNSVSRLRAHKMSVGNFSSSAHAILLAV